MHHFCAIAAFAAVAVAQLNDVVVIGTQQFANIKYYPTNCYNSDTGAHTDEFWTYLTPSESLNTEPTAKFYADPNGNLEWEGNSDINVVSSTLAGQTTYQVQLSANAHSQNAGTLVGALHQSNTGADYPCYVTPADQMRVDFQNGWVCYRLYECSTVPHLVTDVTVSQARTTMSVTERPYENLMAGVAQEAQGANSQIALINNYEQTFVDLEGNSYSYVAEVSNVGVFNLFWTIEAFGDRSNPIASLIDEVYNAGTIYGDVSFPQSAEIVSFVGLDHTSYSKISMFQTSLSPAPPSPSCNSNVFGISSGATGLAIVSAIFGALAVAAAPETAGASLALLGGVVGAGSGALGVLSSAAC